MDIKVYEADLNRINKCMDEFLSIIHTKKLELDYHYEEEFIKYFKKKYIKLPWMRYQLSQYFYHAKNAFTKGNKEKGNSFYTEYCKMKKEIAIEKKEIDELKEENMYY